MKTSPTSSQLPRSVARNSKRSFLTFNVQLIIAILVLGLIQFNQSIGQSKRKVILKTPIPKVQPHTWATLNQGINEAIKAKFSVISCSEVNLTKDTLIDRTAGQILDLMLKHGPKIRQHQFNEIAVITPDLDVTNCGSSALNAFYVATRLYGNGVRSGQLGNYRLNSHCDNHDAQTLLAITGFFGNGAMVTERAWRLGHLFGYGDGVYGGVYSSSLVSASYPKGPSTTRKVALALAALPKKSHYRQVIDDVVRWHYENPKDYNYCLRKLNAKWAPTAINPVTISDPKTNPDAKLNGGIITMALLYAATDSSGRGQTEAANSYCIVAKAGYAVVANAWVVGLINGASGKLQDTVGLNQNLVQALKPSVSFKRWFKSDNTTKTKFDAFANFANPKLPVQQLILEQVPSYRNVQVGALSLMIKPKSSIMVGEKISIKAIAYPTPVKVQWHWGDYTYQDGNLTTESSHQYKQPGRYVISCYALLDNETTLRQSVQILVGKPTGLLIPQMDVSIGQAIKVTNNGLTNWTVPLRTSWFSPDTARSSLAGGISAITRNGIQTKITNGPTDLVVALSDKPTLQPDNYGLTLGQQLLKGDVSRSLFGQSVLLKLPITVPKLKIISPEALLEIGLKLVCQPFSQLKTSSNRPMVIRLGYSTRGLGILIPLRVDNLSMQMDTKPNGQITFDKSDTEIKIINLKRPEAVIKINGKGDSNNGIKISPSPDGKSFMLTVDWNGLGINLANMVVSESNPQDGPRQFGFQLTLQDQGQDYNLFYSLGFCEYDPSELGLIELGD